MAMTLERLANEYRPTMDAEVLHSWAADMVAAVKAHLSRPAQAVDVGAIRMVIDELNGYCEASDDSCYGTLSTSLVRDYTGRLTRAIGNEPSNQQEN